MEKKSMDSLSRRERQIMEIIFQMGESSASEVQKRMPVELSNSSVRTLLRILENKGFLKHEEKGLKYVYTPAIEQKRAQKKALNNLIKTFFNGSPEGVVTAILNSEDIKLSGDELNKLSDIIEKAKKEGK